MKKFITVLLIVVVIQTVDIPAVSAQNVREPITITNADVAPAGTTLVQYIDNNTSGITPGASGADKTWQFTELQEDDRDSLFFALPEWTEYSDQFPESNFAVVIADSGVAYFNRNDDKMSILGAGGSFDEFGLQFINFNPEDILADFPVNFNDERTENFNFRIELESDLPGIDSIRFTQSTTKNVVADAWGTITTPLGSFESLRLMETRLTIDSVFSKIFGNWVFIESSSGSSIRYDWWTDDVNVGYPLLSMVYNPETDEADEIYYLNAFPVGIPETVAELNMVSLFPNPSHGKVSIRFEQQPANRVTYCLFDIRGHQLFEDELDLKSFEYTLDFSYLPDGMYIMTLVSDGRLETHKIVVH